MVLVIVKRSRFVARHLARADHKKAWLQSDHCGYFRLRGQFTKTFLKVHASSELHLGN